MGQHSGNSTATRSHGLADNIRIVTAGLLFNDAVESWQNAALRDSFEFNFEDYLGVMDTTNTKKQWFKKFTGTLVIEDTRFVQVRSAFWRTTHLNDLQFFMKGNASAAKWVTLKENSAALSASAVGARSCAAEVEYTVNDTSNTLKMTLSTAMTMSEYGWIWANSATAATGNTGGTSGTHPTIAFSYANKSAPGIYTLGIDNSTSTIANAGEVGKDSYFTMKSVPIADADQWDRATLRYIEIDSEIFILDMSLAQAAAYVLDMTEAGTSQLITLRSGQVIQLNSGVCSVEANHMMNEKDGKVGVKVKIQGRGVLGALISTTTPCDIGITDAAIMTIVPFGYTV